MKESKKESLIEDNTTFSSRDAIVTKYLPELDASVLTPLMKSIPNNKRRSGHCIIFYLPAILEPIQLWNYTVITLGRYNNHLNLHPTIDLSNHHGSLLGVSRLHAEITFEDSDYYVRDLNSRNGTWVNKTKLMADEKIKLGNQDTLRLAHLMIQVSSYQN